MDRIGPGHYNIGLSNDKDSIGLGVNVCDFREPLRPGYDGRPDPKSPPTGIGYDGRPLKR
ncbi:MAG: hypothetical protein JW727_03180 [Candidatus Aenigmarchaeota archaeon]|nr:hypothetical protein [Candidatus Aenigmarchaeota archaeon]